MKEQELRKIANCAICGKPFGHTGLPLFWRVTIERFGINTQAIQRQDGLAAMLGSSYLASIMGTDEDIAASILGPVKITVCENCALEPIVIAALVENELDDNL